MLGNRKVFVDTCIVIDLILEIVVLVMELV